MRFEGELVAWNEEAGYGSIRPEHGGDEVFVGLRAFPMDGDIPQLGEALSFEIVTGRDGRKQAANVHRVAVSRYDSAYAPLRNSVGAKRYRSARRRRRLAWAAAAVLLVVAGVAGVLQWSHARQAGAAHAVAANARR